MTEVEVTQDIYSLLESTPEPEDWDGSWAMACSVLWARISFARHRNRSAGVAGEKLRPIEIALLRARGCTISDATWDEERARALRFEADYPGYLNSHGLITDIMRDAAAVVSALSTTPAPETMRQWDKEPFNAGYLIACANLMHLHRAEVEATDVLRELGCDRAGLTALGLSAYDLEPLSKLFDILDAQAALRAGGANG